MMERSGWLILVLTLPLVLNACGDDGEGTAAPPLNTPTATRTATNTPTFTLTPTATATHTRTSTRAHTNTVTATHAPTATNTATPTATETTRTPTSTATTTSAVLLQPGPYGVGVTMMTFEDTTRPTMPNGTFRGSPSRVLATEVWYPTAPDPEAPQQGRLDAPLSTGNAPYPLVVYAHGGGAFPEDALYLARHFASRGYVFAAPAFPLTKGNAPGGVNFLDTAEQPADVSFVIDQLLVLNDTPASRFFGAIGAERIGLTGFANGAFTTYLTAFHPALRDARLRAAAPVGNSGLGFSESFFDNAQVPLLILHGDIDAYVPYEGAALSFAQANAAKYLVTIVNGSHLGFADPWCARAELLSNTDELACISLNGFVPYTQELFERLSGADAGLVPWEFGLCTGPSPFPESIRPCHQQQLAILSLYPFFEAYLRGDDAAQRFLEQTLTAENPELEVKFEPTAFIPAKSGERGFLRPSTWPLPPSP